MADDDKPGSDHESATRTTIYGAFPFRRQAWLKWRDMHRRRLESLLSEIQATARPNDVQMELIRHAVRKWM